MALLKEDGSLDVERIDSLPFEEYVKEMATLTQDQYKDYLSKQPLNKSHETTKAVYVDCTMEEDIERNGLVDAEEFLNNLLNDQFLY